MADVLVVGAGPAGATTALLLARQGVAVSLLDRHAFPRPKPCGDCLSARATDLLERLGVLPAVLAASPARLAGWRLVGPDGGDCVGLLPALGRTRRTALAIERARLDALLVRAAVDAGATLRRLRVADLLTDPGGGVAGVVALDPSGRETRLRARLVVGADGLRSVVARRLGLVARPAVLRKVSLTAHVHAPALVPRAGLGEMHLGDRACVGVAPVDAAGGVLNLTLVVDASEAPALKRLGPTAFLTDRLRSFPALGDRLGDLRIERPPLASGPFDRPVLRPTADGAALVGDAAGYYDPFTGQGIHQALAGAERLAEVVLEALEATPGRLPAGALAGYARFQRRLTAGPRRLQRLIEAVVSRPRLAAPAVAALARSPAVADALVAVTGDLRPPASLLSPALIAAAFVPRNPREVPA